MVSQLAGCVEDDDGTDDFAELAGLDTKADGFREQVAMVGDLDFGQAMTTTYAGAPRYRGVGFEASAGDAIEVTVRTPSATPLIWILDADMRIVSTGQVTTRTASGVEAKTRFTATDGTARRYTIMLRTQYLARAELAVELRGTLPKPGCDEDNVVPREVEPRDRAMPRAVLSYIRKNGWGCMHREWHDVRMLASLIGPEMTYVTQFHPEWTRLDPQEGGPGNGLAFLAMHRVMLSMLRAEFPGFTDAASPYADLAGWAPGAVPVDADDAAWPVPAGNPRPFNAAQKTALGNLENLMVGVVSDGLAIETDDDFGRYLETKRRPIEGTPWALSKDQSAGFHNYMHGRFNDSQSPVRMGNFARNIEGKVFWRLHGWIDTTWTRFRKAHGRDDLTDPVYLGAMDEACRDMMRHHAHAPGKSHWDVTKSACVMAH